jgi:hypothetical protein
MKVELPLKKNRAPSREFAGPRPPFEVFEQTTVVPFKQIACAFGEKVMP